MQSAEERRQLLDRLDRDSPSPLAALLKCVTGILVLVITAAGPWAFLSASGPTAVPAANERIAAQANRSLPPGLAESKRVFDERRQRYIEAYPGSRVSREADAQRQRDAHADGGHFAYQSE